MKNKILLSIIGWNYLFDENNTNDCVIKNKEEIEIHFDDYTIEKLKLIFPDKNRNLKSIMNSMHEK